MNSSKVVFQSLRRMMCYFRFTIKLIGLLYRSVLPLIILAAGIYMYHLSLIINSLNYSDIKKAVPLKFLSNYDSGKLSSLKNFQFQFNNEVTGRSYIHMIFNNKIEIILKSF